ncbi:unnamed protein product, partial [marine sediment metagenome]
TLKESIAAIFGAAAPPIEKAPPTEPVVTPLPPPEPAEPVVAEIASLIEEAQQHYNKAQQYLKAGDWAGYGSELDALKTVLERLAELAAE